MLNRRRALGGELGQRGLPRELSELRGGEGLWASKSSAGLSPEQ